MKFFSWDNEKNLRLKAQRIVSFEDLEALQKKALEEGIPYQTLIASVLHKYVSGWMVDRFH